MQNQSATSNEESNLFDFWETLIQRKWWILGTTLLAAIVALVIVNLMKPQWEASAVIRIGAVGQVGQIRQMPEAKQLIEPVPQVVERVKLKSFKDTVLANLGISLDEENPLALLYRDSLKIKALRDTDLIEMNVRGYSREGAKRSAEATIACLKKVHDKLAFPTVQNLRQVLAQTELQINQTKAERDELAKLTSQKNKSDFMERVVLANTMIQQESELRRLEQAKIYSEEQLSPMRTYPTSYIERISVSEEPVEPKKSQIIVLAGVLGLFLGVMAAFLSNAVQTRK